MKNDKPKAAGPSGTGLDPMGRTALMNAIIDRRLDDARRELMKGADPNVADRNGLTALHFASRDHSLELVTLLVEHGANVNAQDRHGNSPLGDAIFSTKPRLDETVAALLAAGADKDLKNKSGVSAVGLAETMQDPHSRTLLR
jgi:ankyrin repeat protein